MTCPFNPTSQQMSALRRVYSVPGQRQINDIPRAVLNECKLAGWLLESDGEWSITSPGITVMKSRL